jgi:hypothetical protein
MERSPWGEVCGGSGGARRGASRQGFVTGGAVAGNQAGAARAPLAASPRGQPCPGHPRSGRGGRSARRRRRRSGIRSSPRARTPSRRMAPEAERWRPRRQPEGGQGIRDRLRVHPSSNRLCSTRRDDSGRSPSNLSPILLLPQSRGRPIVGRGLAKRVSDGGGDATIGP